ncbi:LysR family transcriptional regulator [Xenophilus arseniciresistens]|uniref:LysR family transcriptional regulator n=1 Tax=Xenophilus arseniciresistens TaxID=1283306 RepID=A0AAE3SYN2_9BURK|nr:LysR family transcriptional regulator [Xenophilus arseniciresistens]MDA7416282.1 LysR family transcriptional regulator [Xenophilus arseniciresistens]
MILNLRELQAFKAIAKLGSLGKAAEALSLTQPALTRTLQRLEHQLGVPLFERHANGVSLTDYGRALEPHAGLMLAESEQAVRELREMLGQERGVVRVGAVASAVENFLPPAIDRLTAGHPGLQVQVVEGMSDSLAVQLAKGEVDLVIGFAMPQSEAVSLVSESQWQEGCHIVCAADHPLRTQGRLTLAQLEGQRWALPPRHTGPREEWHQTFWTQGLATPPVAVETASINAIRTLVQRCGFLSWMPRLLLGEPTAHAPGLHILDVQGVRAARTFALYQRRHGTLSAATVRLRDDLLQMIRALPRTAPG